MICIQSYDCHIFAVWFSLVRFFYFFFFKQKTAYEMRISDWSSDVCSSDLRAAGQPGAATPGPGGAARPGYRLAGAAPAAAPARLAGRALRSLQPEIGRASCRERVCQYV